MKSYRNAAAALLLALVLSASALAGVMQTGVASPEPEPTPMPSSTTETARAGGEVQTGEAASTPVATDAGAEVVLNLLQSVLSLF